jgi:predicted HTH domain antitoxin
MPELILSYPDDLAQDIRVPPERLAAHIGLMAALKMFELGEISSGRAAELAGLSRVDFLEACGRYHVAAFNYADEEIDAELRRDIVAAGGRTL